MVPRVGTHSILTFDGVDSLHPIANRSRTDRKHTCTLCLRVNRRGGARSWRSHATMCGGAGQVVSVPCSWRKGGAMKLIIAIIGPEKLAAVEAALHEQEACLMSVSHVMGDGRESGRTTIYRGT